MVGDFRVGGNQPNSGQRNALNERLRANKSRFNVTADNVLGHNEFANVAGFNHRSNTCLGMDMNLLRGEMVTIVDGPVNASREHVVVASDTLGADSKG